MTASPKTALIMAGGTGGHIFPALAVAEALREQGWRCVWLGVATGMEARLVPNRGFECQWIEMAGVRGKGVGRLLKAPFLVLRALKQCRAVIKQVQPDLVLGFGGYVTVPGGLAAKLAGVPVIVHEQNSVAGLSNKLLAKWAKRVLIAFPGAFKAKNNVVLSGNPVRPEICNLPAPNARYAIRTGPLKLLVLGGSLGAKVLNETVPQSLAKLSKEDCFEVTHQSGETQLPALQEAYAKAGVAADTVAFIADMASAYREADLIICRAGALTVAEVAAAGVAALFVPFPHAVDDHQTGNARFLAEEGAALLIAQSELTVERLAVVLHGLTRDRLKEMAVKAYAKARPQATADVVAQCIEVAGA